MKYGLYILLVHRYLSPLQYISNRKKIEEVDEAIGMVRQNLSFSSCRPLRKNRANGSGT